MRTLSDVVVRIESRPTMNQWAMWWETLQGEDLPYAFNDDFPSTLDDVIARMQRGLWDTKCCVDDTGAVIGMLWLHDIRHRMEGTTRMIDTGWLGAYYMPAFRGKLGAVPYDLAMMAWRWRGLRHVFAAVHERNRVSQAGIEAHTDLRFVCIVPGPTPFRGAYANLHIYASPGGEDEALAQMLERIEVKEGA